MPRKGQHEDLTGQVFHLLTVIEHSHTDHYGAHWLCRCECGGQTTTRATRLKGGGAKSCGCLLKEAGQRTKTHGLTRDGDQQSKEYNAWSRMKQRCINPDDGSYENYGGRGITVFPEWLDDFMAFYNHVGPAPSPDHSVGRIDNEGHYEPGNVRWETQDQQANNRRTNTVLDHEGRRQTASQWAVEKHMLVDTLCKRLATGWSVARALDTPVRQGKYNQSP